MNKEVIRHIVKCGNQNYIDGIETGLKWAGANKLLDVFYETIAEEERKEALKTIDIRGAWED